MDERPELWLIRPEFPRANTYDVHWLLDNQMGPNALWLTEWLCKGMNLELACMSCTWGADGRCRASF
jgi:hypothetical protein